MSNVYSLVPVETYLLVDSQKRRVICIEIPKLEFSHDFRSLILLR